MEIGYIVPKEGAAMSFDNFVIPEDAPHPDEAHIFLDYMLRPDIAARNSNHVLYANGNRDSQPLLDEAVIGDASIYPDAVTMARLFTAAAGNAAQGQPPGAWRGPLPRAAAVLRLRAAPCAWGRRGDAAGGNAIGVAITA